jgi:hypothetical protein
MLNPTKTDADRAALDLLIRGFQISRMLRLIADLGVADKIPKEGGCDVSELAKACEVLPTQLLRVLRALAAFEIFHVTPNGHVTHSPRSLLLHTDTPNNMHDGARFWTAPGSWSAWGALDAALTGGDLTGLPGTRAAFSIFASTRRKLEYSIRSWPISLTTDTTLLLPPMTSPMPC